MNNIDNQLEGSSYSMVREKEPQTRIYDNEGYRRRASCLCVRDELENEVLLVSSSSSRGRWVVPGGGLEPHEDSREAAIREVIEEAGVKGHIIRPLGTFQNNERKHRTDVFILVVTQELSEWEDAIKIGRGRKWFTLNEAIDVLSEHKPIECDYIRLLIKNKTN
ncbi:diphosphoinositol polyphosphate phosphohydrolase 1-like [Panonychus citri]|uniref:diphosphoinositol polyphosphate phosphohydrolase 1-like n=1 Tax=Panonychus citri TaxID=50023 RepID=UPI002306FC23|nr:diphosphoinositol polyphosphate phosphohydrolase 1-like [Panonychus citri]XP_053208220.1 diphosphoinositol polyphosphate phosphohydrolase 1-like [Panonychus citri]XP_053208221.1 diphosphoinositol polyphosphate phosphohydrolase 1-like [Panonychus citri]XP_053208222.1 diphosphoinositol polyphosphate phosphohydrolase 1-like [Panonychus citri]